MSDRIRQFAILTVLTATLLVCREFRTPDVAACDAVSVRESLRECDQEFLDHTVTDMALDRCTAETARLRWQHTLDTARLLTCDCAHPATEEIDHE